VKIGLSNYDDLVGRLLNISSQIGGLASEVSPEISPVFVLESDRVEWCYLKGERCMAGGVYVAAVAAQQSVVSFRNPAGSNVLCVIEDGNFISTAGLVQLFLGGARTANLTTTGSTLSRDSRQRTQQGACTVTGQAGVAEVGTVVERMDALLSNPFRSFPLVLVPGTSVDVSVDTVNVVLYASFRWSERELRKYEL